MELENNFKRKILNGLVRSCEKRPVRYQQLEDITNKVSGNLEMKDKLKFLLEKLASML